ncbi:MAG: hypothetical protein ACYCOU_24350 [Sulfobacillus sp.]
MGWSKKPCPGCGTPGHRTDSVCITCAQLLRDGRRRQTEYAQRLAEYRTYELIANPRDYPGTGLPWEHDQALCTAVGVALTALADRPELRGVRFPSPGYPEATLVRDEHSYRRITPVIEVPLLPEQAAAVQALVPAIKQGIRTAYNLGLAEGQDLLRQLAAGHITAATFDERTRSRSAQ